MDRYLEDVKKLQDVIEKTKDADVLAQLKKALAALQITDYTEVKTKNAQLVALKKSCENALDKLELEARDYEEVSQFCSSVDKIKASYKDIDDADFIRMVVLRFGTDAYARYDASEKDHGEWKKLKDWILVEFSSGLSVLQLIGRAFDTPFETSRGWKHFSICVENRLQCAEAAIMKKLNEKKIGVKTEKTGETYKPSAREIIQFFGAAIVSDRIKLEDNDLFNRMATQWKDCNSANEVGNNAQYLHAQSVSSDNYHVARNRSNFERSKSGQPGARKSRTSCNHGMTCPFLIHHGKCLKFHTRDEIDGAKREREKQGIEIRPRPNRNHQRDENRRTYITEDQQLSERNESESQIRENASSIFH
jgi:hypothetical protein